MVPPLLGLASDRFNDTGRAMVVPLAFFAVGWSYPIGLNVFPKLRAIVDEYSGRTGFDQEQGVPAEKLADTASVDEYVGGKGAISQIEKS